MAVERYPSLPSPARPSSPSRLHARPGGTPLRLACLALALGALAGCATRPDPADPEAVAEFRATNDPIEPLNRGVYFVNEGLDTLVVRPATELYRIALPPEVRTGVRNVLGNLRTPVILANDLLQGEGARAQVTASRFVVNSTAGVLGLFDVAKNWGLPAHTEDFGQTLAVWGVGPGPYLYLPVLGPSNPRDAAGFAAGIAADPLTWVGGANAAGYARTGLTVLDTRESLIEPLDQVRATSLDPYATIRSAYRQRRAAEIGNRGEAPAAATGTGFGVGTGISGSPR
jgi:phospholipid-binding lipoprotein MlaA